MSGNAPDRQSKKITKHLVLNSIAAKWRVELKYGDLRQRVLAIKNFFGELK